MNANSKPKAPRPNISVTRLHKLNASDMTIREWLVQAASTLTSHDISSAQLDAEVLLAHVLDVNRTWLIAHGDEIIDTASLSRVKKLLIRREQHEPTAYLVGHKEFYGREFTVTPDVLIPRPESEKIIEIAKTIKLPDHAYVVDVGCGSGCIGLTLKLEMPAIEDIILCDVSKQALMLAKRNNRERFHLRKIQYYHSDLLSFWLQAEMNHTLPIIDLITANLPYVDTSWQRSPETDHEPALAIIADDGGLALIKKCIQQSQRCLTQNGYLLLEADPCQHADIAAYAHNFGFKVYDIQEYIIVLQRNPAVIR